MCFIFHRWSKWSNIIQDDEGDGSFYQFRFCMKCRTVDYKKLEVK